MIKAALVGVVLGVMPAAGAFAQAPVALKLAPPSPTALTSPAAAEAPVSRPPGSTTDLSFSLQAPEDGRGFEPRLPGIPGATLVFKERPRSCPTDYPWCDQSSSGSALAAVQDNLGAGVGVDLGGLKWEYARGSHFDFLGVGTRFSP